MCPPDSHCTLLGLREVEMFLLSTDYRLLRIVCSLRSQENMLYTHLRPRWVQSIPVHILNNNSGQ